MLGGVGSVWESMITLENLKKTGLKIVRFGVYFDQILS